MNDDVINTQNEIYVRRQSKLLLPDLPPGTPANDLLALETVASLAKNVQSLGYVLSPALMEACRKLPISVLTPWYENVVALLQKARGSYRMFAPFYPNFPRQVMEAHAAELFMNAIAHYWTNGQWRPDTPKDARPALDDDVVLVKLDIGDLSDFENLFTLVAASNTSLSQQDKDDLRWFVRTYKDGIARLLPPAVPQKENAAVLSALLIEYTDDSDWATGQAAAYVQTATDVLRLAVALSSGDVSLADATKFVTLSRRERRFLLDLLNRLKNPVEDMLRWKSRWIRLGEKLHPGEFKSKYGWAYEAFQILRNDVPVRTFNGSVEVALKNGDGAKAAHRLSSRPGDMARRLDHLLRIDAASRDEVLATFEQVAERVSTPVLLQVRQHFAARGDALPLRVFFPKGSLVKAHGEPNNLPILPQSVCNRAVFVCEAALIKRFHELPPLGASYLDPTLHDYPIPFAARSASKSLRTLARGTRLSLPDNCRVLRFFVWWKNGKERTDIDLSASLFNADFQFMEVLSYYNLKNFGGAHSGDIVDAPDGASEFIDVELDKLKAGNVRYVVMTLHSFTEQPYKDLPECFAGWMAREEAESGEVFEPKTVHDRLDITADTKIAVPVLFDVETRRAIWCDMSLNGTRGLVNNVATTESGISATLRALVTVRRPNLYDLFRLHIAARGEEADTPETAQTVFSVENGTPFQHEKIAGEFLQ